MTNTLNIRESAKKYNETPSQELLQAIRQQTTCGSEIRSLYEHHRKLLLSLGAAGLPSYDDLPLQILWIDGQGILLFDKTTARFLLNTTTNPWQDLYAMMAQSSCTHQELKNAYIRCARMEVADQSRAQLRNMILENSYGKAYLDALEIFLENSDDSERFFYAGRYAFAHGNYPLALNYGRSAYALRSLNPDIWKLLVDAYEALEQDQTAVLYKTLFGTVFETLPGKPLIVSDPSCLRAFILGNIHASLAPFYWNPDFSGKELEFNLCPSNGSFLLNQPENTGDYRYWCGIYNTDCFFNKKANHCAIYTKERINDIQAYSNFMFDIMKSAIAKEIRLSSPNHAYTVAVAGTTPDQLVQIATEGHCGTVILGQHEFRYLRLEGTANISSTEDFAIAEPIPLAHSPQRKKLVLNILLDGLSWGRMKKEKYRHVPNLMKFFSKGILFDNNYSVAEYTFPSLATIETGLHMHRSQVFDDKRYMFLDSRCRTLSEALKGLGYYCVNIIGDGRGIYNGVTRGFDRLVVTPFLKLPAYEGVHRTIEHLEAFSECDNFLFMHITDPHTFYVGNTPQSVSTQTKVPYYKFLYEQGTDETSVRLKGKDFYQRENLHMIEQMDHELKPLWEYIESHYAEDEYMVHVYSDHGSSAYTETPYYFSEDQCCSALMIRGGPYPASGISAELTSTMDLYAIILHGLGIPSPPYRLDANLPAVLGGKEREYVISNSIFPGQTYKLCIRTASHEFRLETAKPTRMDGTIDMTSYTWELYQRNESHKELFDARLKNFFMNIAYDHVKSFQHSEL